MTAIIDPTNPSRILMEETGDHLCLALDSAKAQAIVNAWNATPRHQREAWQVAGDKAKELYEELGKIESELTRVMDVGVAAPAIELEDIANQLYDLRGLAIVLLNQVNDVLAPDYPPARQDLPTSPKGTREEAQGGGGAAGGASLQPEGA